MKQDNLTEIRSKLWHSAEMAFVRLQIIVYTVLLLVWCLIPCFAENRSILLPIMAAIGGVCFAPFVVFWLWRTVQIFRSPEEYVFCRTELCQPHHAPIGRGMFSFMGVIETEEEGRFPVETHAIFQSAGARMQMEDYLGKTVTIAWNRETDLVVVIG